MIFQIESPLVDPSRFSLQLHYVRKLFAHRVVSTLNHAQQLMKEKIK